MSRWITVDYFGPFNPEPACYAIYDKAEGLVYIGETINMAQRINGHGFICSRYSQSLIARSWKNFRFSDIMFKIKYSKRLGEEAMTERRLIHRLKPKLNKKGKNINKNG